MAQPSTLSAAPPRHEKGDPKVAFLKVMKWSGDYFTPFFERRVPLVAPWRALNFGFDLQMT